MLLLSTGPRLLIAVKNCDLITQFSKRLIQIQRTSANYAISLRRNICRLHDGAPLLTFFFDQSPRVRDIATRDVQLQLLKTPRDLRLTNKRVDLRIKLKNNRVGCTG